MACPTAIRARRGRPSAAGPTGRQRDHPDYALGNHTASFGLGCFTRAFFPGSGRAWSSASPDPGTAARLPATRSSSCRSSTGDLPGPREIFLAGFLRPTSDAVGRPVGVALGPHGSLLVADDVGDVIWRVTGA